MNWLSIALLPLVLSGQSITGKLVDSIPLPLRNAPVGLLPVGADGVTKSTHTDSNGAFRFAPVEPGEYVIIARVPGFRSRVQAVHSSPDGDANLGTLKLLVANCEGMGVCDYVTKPSLPRPPVVDLCDALKSPDRYGNKLIVLVGMLSTLHGWPTLTAKCDSMLASGGLTWTNAVLLPEGAAPRQFPKSPNIRGLKKNLEDLAAIVRKTSGSATSRVVAVYGFLDVPDGLHVVPCTGDSCPHPAIRVPPASFLSVDGFQELK